MVAHPRPSAFNTYVEHIFPTLLLFSSSSGVSKHKNIVSQILVRQLLYNSHQRPNTNAVPQKAALQPCRRSACQVSQAPQTRADSTGAPNPALEQVTALLSAHANEAQERATKLLGCSLRTTKNRPQTYVAIRRSGGWRRRRRSVLIVRQKL